MRPGYPLGGSETKAFGRVQQTRSVSLEFVGMGRRFIGIEEQVAVRCPCCDAVDVDTRHARICPRAGPQVN